MQRIRTVGLCLVAIVAMSMLVAANASAEGPEYRTCIKANPKNTGHYSDKACSAEEPQGKGTYERGAWNQGKGAAFKGKNSGTARNTIVNPITGEGSPGKIEATTECANEKLLGQVTGPKTSTWKTTFLRCKGNGTPCNTSGQKPGTILTDQLESTLVNLEKGPTPKRVGMRVKGEGPGGRLAQYECPELKTTIEVFGEVLAEVKGNLEVASKSTEIVAKEGPLALQSDLYEEEAQSEATGKGYFEWGIAFEACVKQEAEKGKSVAEAEAACFKALGPWPGFPNKPISLISAVSGAITARAPSTQNAITFIKGEALLIQGGVPAPPSGTVAGTVTETPPKAAQLASISICGTGGCYDAETNESGHYEIHGVADGTYVAHVSPLGGSTDGELTSSSFSVSGTGETTENFTLTGPTPVPPGTAVVGNRTVEIGGEHYPQIFWQSETPITTHACQGGTVTATVTAVNTQTGLPESTSPVMLAEAPPSSGVFEGNLPAVFPLHGQGKVTLAATNCTLPSEEDAIEFTLYIDPSGKVVDGNKGNSPLPNATVRLLRSPSKNGTYEEVESGSTYMSLANRVNADASSGLGLFGWDVQPGFYKVEAFKPGCGTTTTAILEIPPAVVNLELVLHCVVPLTITTSSLPAGKRGQPYSVQLTAIEGVLPYKWKKTVTLPKGLKLSKTGLLSGTPKEALSPGMYPIDVKVSDSGKKGTKQTATASLSLELQ
jgi:hypothetical protein